MTIVPLLHPTQDVPQAAVDLGRAESFVHSFLLFVRVWGSLTGIWASPLVITSVTSLLPLLSQIKSVFIQYLFFLWTSNPSA